jgi:hypothetical protein
METLRLYLQPWNLRVDDGDLDASYKLKNNNFSSQGINNILIDQPLTLYDTVPTDWPLKRSPNYKNTEAVDRHISGKTKNKTQYKY